MKLPKEIYLQIVDDVDIPIKRLDEATWCSDKIHWNDVRYIRADLGISGIINVLHPNYHDVDEYYKD